MSDVVGNYHTFANPLLHPLTHGYIRLTHP